MSMSEGREGLMERTRGVSESTKRRLKKVSRVVSMEQSNAES